MPHSGTWRIHHRGTWLTGRAGKSRTCLVRTGILQLRDKMRGGSWSDSNHHRVLWNWGCPTSLPRRTPALKLEENRYDGQIYKRGILGCHHAGIEVTATATFPPGRHYTGRLLIDRLFRFC